MSNFIVATSLKNIHKADQVAVYVCMRISNGVTHTGLCRQMHHSVKLMLGKHSIDGCLISQLNLFKGKAFKVTEPAQTTML